MLNIKNQAYITLKVDGSPVEVVNIKSMTLAEGNGAYAPTMRLEIDDPTSLLSRNYALNEANVIEIMIARTPNDTGIRSRKYRLFGPSRNNPTRNTLLTMIGLLDAPKYFSASLRERYIGNTTSVLSEVAGKVGLEYIGPDKGRNTNDSQTWWDVCTTRARFIHEVTRHGYMDDKGGMASTVTSYKELRYKNIIDVINTPPAQVEFVFAHNSQNSAADSGKTYIVKEVQDKSTSGVMSSWQNYGSTRQHNNIDGKPRTKKTADVQIPNGDSYLVINETVSEEIDRSRVEYAQIDCSNTHKKYQEAVYQNLRVLGAFSETISLLVDVVTDVQLFDPVIYRQADADISSKVRNEDVYMVVGKTIVVRGGVHYAERIQCSRISVSMKGTADLKTTLDAGDTSEGVVGGMSGANSIITQPSMGGNPGILGLGNMSVVSGITSLLGLVGNLGNGLGNLSGNLSSIVGGTLGPLGNILGSLTGGGGINLNQLLGVLGTSMGGAGQQVSQVQNLAAQGPNALANLASSTTGQPDSVVSAVMSGNSVMDTLYETVKMVTMYGMLGSVAQNTYQASPATSRNSTEGQALYNSTTAMNSTLNTAADTTATMWNSVLASIYGTPPPSPLQTVQSTGLQMRLASLMAQPGVTKEQIMAFMVSEMSKQNNGQPNWLPRTELAPTYQQTPSLTSIASDTEMLTAMMNNSSRI